MARVQLQIRLAEAGVDRLDALAREFELNRSDVIRACFSVALPTRELREKLKSMKESNL